MGFPSFHVNKSLIEVQARPGQTRQEAPLAFGEIGGFIWSSSVVKVTNMMKTEYPTISCNQIRQTRGGRGGGEESCAHSFNNFCEYRSTPKSSYFGDTKFGWVGSGGVGPGPRILFPLLWSCFWQTVSNRVATLVEHPGPFRVPYSCGTPTSPERHPKAPYSKATPPSPECPLWDPILGTQLGREVSGQGVADNVQIMSFQEFWNHFPIFRLSW